MNRTTLSALALGLALAAAPASAAISINNTGAMPNTWTVNGPGFTSAAVTVTPTLPNLWVANTAESSWVSVNAQGNSTTSPATQNGAYTYSTNFTGMTGDVLDFWFWADDDVLSVSVNGNIVSGLTGGTYTEATRGSFTLGTDLGANQLTFTVRNNGTPAGGNPTGFRFQQIPAVPEPATWAMMLVGFGMVAGAARYRRRATQVRFA